MQRKSYLIALFEQLPEDKKADFAKIRARYELEANKRRPKLTGAILQRVLTKEEIVQFEQFYNEAHIKVFGQEELRNAQAYLAGGLQAKAFLKTMKVIAPHKEENLLNMADQIAGRIVRTIKPKV